MQKRLGLLYSLFALMAVSTSAAAIDGEDFGSNLKRMLAHHGWDLTYESVGSAGDMVIFSGVGIALTGETPTKISGGIVFEGVQPRGDGRYTSNVVSVPDIRHVDEDVTINVDNIRFHDISIKEEIKEETRYEDSPVGGLSIGPVSLEVDGKVGMSIQQFELSSESDDAKEVFINIISIDNFFFDLDATLDQDDKGRIESLGIAKLIARFDSQIRWHRKRGLLDFRAVDLSVDNIGELKVSAAFLGYDEELQDALTELDNLVKAADDDSKSQKEALSEEFVGLLGELELGGLQIRFDDDTITEKVIGLMAEQEAMTPLAMASGLAALLADLAAKQGVSEANQKELLIALQTFLIDSHNIAFASSAQRPIRLDEFTSIISSDRPLSLIDRLDLTITANQ